MKIGFKNHNPSPNHTDFPNLLATSKYVTIMMIANKGMNNKDRIHRGDLPASLNRSQML